MFKPVYQVIASAFQARLNCEKSGNTEWHGRHADRIESLVQELAPSGSGFDNGTSFNMEESKPERLVFDTAFHHMNDGGYYDGWSHHKVIVTPSLVFGFDMRITGQNKRDIKEYMLDVFSEFLSKNID